MEKFVLNQQGIPSIQKDPAATLDYSFDWTEYLAAIADTIASKVITVSAGLTKASDAVAGGVVTAWVSGGTEGGAAETVSCKITTAGGRVDERTINLIIKGR
ncbi:MAG: hypothetical protein NTW42_07575 [Deltaproteobacteria bacterium]|nr:hypothetical protein [Deltaproteobacteria bacterium]